MSTEKVHKGSNKFHCIACDYSTSRKSQYDRHLMTRKHITSTSSNKLGSEGSKINHVCECGKVYKERSGLYKHKKKCNANNLLHETIDTSDTNVESLIEENRKLKQILMGIKNNMESTSNETNHINYNNKVYNINIHVNKDPINDQMFIESIHMDVEDAVDMDHIEDMMKVKEGVNTSIIHDNDKDNDEH